MKINPEKIRDVIGKGGATIRQLTEETGCTIDIAEDGTITIGSTDAARIRAAAMDRLGRAPDVVVLAPPQTVLKTSSGKIRRAAIRDAYLAGTLGAPSRAAWVQVLRLPGFEPVGQFGQEELQTPYGLWLDTRQAGAVTAYVTDSFMADFRTMTLPPMAELAGRVKRFQVRIEDGGKLETRLLGQFGDTGAAGALRMVESIAGDPAHGRLLIAEEAGHRHPTP